MARQNIYDDADFFVGYQTLRAHGAGYNERIEQPAVRSLLPSPDGLVIVDLGCGTGAHAVELAAAGARQVVAIDPSERMLASAEPHPRVQYRHAFAEDVSFPPASIDLVVASLSLHYVADLGGLLGGVATWLRPGGRIVASMEHPLVTATGRRCATGGHPIIEDYRREGPRSTHWFVDGVIKHHRTLETIVAAFTTDGLRITDLLEPTATDQDIAAQPNLASTRDCPPFVVISAGRPSHR